MKKEYLVSFIERLNTYQVVRTNAFYSLYNEWFVEVIKALENEIFENLLLTSIDKVRYLKYVKKQVTDKIAYQKDTKFLDKWIKKYQIVKSTFPFTDNEEVQQLLDTNIKESILDYTMKKLCANMQMDFYCHAAMIEKYNMIAFIDSLLSKENDNYKSIVNKNNATAHKNKNWFKIGLLFANGEMDILLKKYNSNGAQIAKHLGNQTGFRPYITESIGVKKETSKQSIFSDRKKMQIIIAHCETENIIVIPDFIKRLPIE